jgi:hypothetical protein
MTIVSLGTWRDRLFRTADFDCLEANSIIHGIVNPLLPPWVTLRCLYWHMAKQIKRLLADSTRVILFHESHPRFKRSAIGSVNEQEPKLIATFSRASLICSADSS